MFKISFYINIFQKLLNTFLKYKNYKYKIMRTLNNKIANIERRKSRGN